MNLTFNIQFSEYYSVPSDIEGFQREIIQKSMIQARKTLEFLSIWAHIGSSSAPVNLSCWAAFQQLHPQPGASQEFLGTREQDPVLILILLASEIRFRLSTSPCRGFLPSSTLTLLPTLMSPQIYY